MTTVTPTTPTSNRTASTPTRRTAHSAIPTLAARRLALSIRSPRALFVPLLTPVLFALVIAPALGNTVGGPTGHHTYMTFVALATAGLLIPLNCMFSGIGVIVDRQQGAMRELLVAPIRRSSIVLGNLVAAVAVTALQLAVLIGAAEARGARFTGGGRVVWFAATALVFSVLMYAMAEILAVRLPTPEAYIAALPAIAIVPYFFAGSLFPITSLPHWLDGAAKVLPLTHALALFRYGLTGHSGVQALHNIWGLHSATAMAFLSLGVVVLYSVVAFQGALRLFTKAGTS
jgi:ABC-2 type transport system permease protein